MKNELVARFLIPTNCLTVFYLGEFEKDSLTYRIMDQAGTGAHLSLWFLAALSILALVDLLINDVLNDKYSWKWVKPWRQEKWTLMGLSFFLYAYVVVKTGLSTALSVNYVMNGVGCLAIAVLIALEDMKNRLSAEEVDFYTKESQDA